MIQRYRPDPMISNGMVMEEYEDGEYVLFADYAKRVQELEEALRKCVGSLEESRRWAHSCAKPECQHCADRITAIEAARAALRK